MFRFLISVLLAVVPLCCGQMLSPIVADTHHGTTTFTGAGDVITSNSIAWWGLRAYSAATRGNKLANVCDAGDAHCVDMLSDATTGNAVIPLSNPNCASSACTIKTIYDQTGNLSCAGSVACDLTQATATNRPTLTTSCLGSLVCASFTGSAQILTIAVFPGAHGQPISSSTIMRRTGSTAAYNTVMGTGASTGTLQVGYTSSANTIFFYAGNTIVNGTASEGSFHAVQALWNNASSVLYIDGSSNAANLGSTTGIQDTVDGEYCFGDCANSPNGTQFVEGGWWSTDKSANFSALNSNQHAYWGF